MSARASAAAVCYRRLLLRNMKIINTSRRFQCSSQRKSWGSALLKDLLNINQGCRTHVWDPRSCHNSARNLWRSVCRVSSFITSNHFPLNKQAQPSDMQIFNLFLFKIQRNLLSWNKLDRAERALISLSHFKPWKKAEPSVGSQVLYRAETQFVKRLMLLCCFSLISATLGGQVSSFGEREIINNWSVSNGNSCRQRRTAEGRIITHGTTSMNAGCGQWQKKFINYAQYN